MLALLFSPATVRAQGTYEAYSPVVSYVYLDALPDDVVMSFSSAPVSYHLLDRLPGPDVAVQGRVRDEAGAALAGARVSAAVNLQPLAETQAGADGSFQLPALAGGLYALVASRPGFAPASRVVELQSGLPAQDFVLKRLPAPPEVSRTADPVPERQRERKPRTSSVQLKSFQNGEWVADAAVDPNRMTIVLTHGWILCAAADGGIVGWPTRMARQLHEAGVTARANLLAWDWRDGADTCLLPEADKAIGPPVDRTRAQGLALGKALHETFGASYAKEVHFLGHSLGALVNAEAANYLHGDGATARTRAPQPWDPERTHVTLFDEAEIAVVAGQQARQGAKLGSDFAGLATAALPIKLAAGALGFTVAAINDWRNPIPVRSAWVDNYLSLVGINHPNAVNVCLQQDTVDALADLDVVKAHGVPMPWYGTTIGMPGLSVMGFTNSFELRDRLPPAGDAYTLGRLYLQRSIADRFNLRPATDDDFTQCQQEIAKLVAGEVLSEVKATAKGVIRGAGEVAADTREWLAAQTDALQDGLFSAVNELPNFAGFPGLRITLRSLPLPKPAGGARPQGLPEGETHSPAYAWMTVAIPAEAVFLVFDFTVAGDGAEDSVVGGINGTNRFSLETQFVAPDVRTSSSQMDVSALAGTDAELFFGLLGGTSANCTLTVEGIRFLTLAAPTLRVAAVDNGQLTLAWPTAAVGYRLEEATVIGATDWTAVDVQATQANGEFVLVRPMTGEAQFFRLRRR